VSHAYTIKVTLIEIYNEALRDLLEPRDEIGKDKVCVCLCVCVCVCIIGAPCP
jgi:hypothetical protein